MPKKCPTPVEKVWQKNISVTLPPNKICEIPNYAVLIEDHRKNHVEYYKMLHRTDLE